MGTTQTVYIIMMLTIVLIVYLIGEYKKIQDRILKEIERTRKTINEQIEITEKTLGAVIKNKNMNAYAEYLINDMVDFRKTTFRDAALAVRFDDILGRWQTYKEIENMEKEKKGE